MCGQLCVCVYVCMCVCVCVCVSPPLRLLITSSMIWTPYDWLNKFCSFCVVAIVGIVSRHGLSNESQPNKRKLALYKPSILFNSSLKWLYIKARRRASVIKVGEV